MFSSDTGSLEEVRRVSDEWKRRVRAAPRDAMPIPPPTLPRFIQYAGTTYDMMIGIHQQIVRRLLNEGMESVGLMSAARQERGA